MLLRTIKAHVKDNAKMYIVGASCVVVGSTITFVALRNLSATDTKVISKVGGIHYKSTNIIQTTLERRGHPGNIVRCIETGEVFASQNRAADALKISPTALGRHLKGLRNQVGGLTFETLGEAA